MAFLQQAVPPGGDKGVVKAGLVVVVAVDVPGDAPGEALLRVFGHVIWSSSKWDKEKNKDYLNKY